MAKRQKSAHGPLLPKGLHPFRSDLSDRLLEDDSLEDRFTGSTLWRRQSTWVLTALLSALVVFLTWTSTLRISPSSLTRENIILTAEPPIKSTNLTDAVQWDNYTLWVNRQRVFLHSGEFHTFRLPVPDMWLDIFQKMVAAGLNCASIYVHWGVSNPAPGVLDFEDWRALQPFFDAAKLAGIWITLRPGPYVSLSTLVPRLPG